MQELKNFEEHKSNCLTFPTKLGGNWEGSSTWSWERCELQKRVSSQSKTMTTLKNFYDGNIFGENLMVKSLSVKV
jgi:hypothetical protein